MSNKTQKLEKNLESLQAKASEITKKLDGATKQLETEKAKAGASIVSGTGNLDQLSGLVAKAQGVVATLEAAWASVNDQIKTAEADLATAKLEEARADVVARTDAIEAELIEAVQDLAKRAKDYKRQHAELNALSDLSAANDLFLEKGRVDAMRNTFPGHVYRDWVNTLSVVNQDWIRKALAGEL